ncbi:MAG: hypothetical protein KUG56_01435 [Kordiimonadaceae bacterium]|nr:hypothetical protein [Kordiimonadaceae bacterium]
MTAQILALQNRAVIRLSGADSIKLLQGLVTNDVAKVGSDTAVYAGMLTPQGKFLFDMIIVADGDDLLLDVEASSKPNLIRKLTLYKLRADVTITDEDTTVWALFNGTAEQGIAYKDPRHKALQQRVIATENPCPAAQDLQHETYEERRIRHGVPDGSRDIIPEKYFWLETNAEKINGVSFSKGCYVGQELTARMKHRTNLKKCLTPVRLNGDVQPGDTLKTAEGKPAGEIRTVANGHALAYLRLEHKAADLRVGDVAVSVKAAEA